LRRDPAIRAVDAARLIGLYSGGIDPAHQRLTLDVAGGPALPPTLIQAGGAEMLLADSRHLAADIHTAGAAAGWKSGRTRCMYFKHFRGCRPKPPRRWPMSHSSSALGCEPTTWTP